MVQLVRVQDALPEGFAYLRSEADAEGFRAMSRLAAEWAATPEMFACLLAAPDGMSGLDGIGGLTLEPEPAGQAAMRMRRLYVRPGARRRGVGRTLVNALLQEALDGVSLVTINAGGTLAPAFWEALGFEPVEGRPWTHQFSAH
ncbi:MAG: GNAT family N-acetyltransferase [Phenylobacterium sp.]|nr:GNAT family N-acetyltransferase [Phenylobacterium sp.]